MLDSYPLDDEMIDFDNQNPYPFGNQNTIFSKNYDNENPLPKEHTSSPRLIPTSSLPSSPPLSNMSDSEMIMIPSEENMLNILNSDTIDNENEIRDDSSMLYNLL